MDRETWTVRQDWNRSEIAEIYHGPLLSLMFRAAAVHQQYHKLGELQLCTLLSIKTGGCLADCTYCSQAARYHTGVQAQKILDKETILEAAGKAKAAGSSRFCMGAAWRQVRNSRDFDHVLDVASAVRNMGLEVCCTMGMVTTEQAQKLKAAGVYAYNHNLDTGAKYYEKVISTREYEDRLKTLENIRKAGLSVCCGGILGMGESDDDRIDLLHTLATMPEHPESVPINALISVKGTPLENRQPISIWVLVRMIAVARIVMPKAMIRLSAGRVHFSHAEQTLCFMAGANSIHTGEKLLTTSNCGLEDDQELIDILGLIPKKAAAKMSEDVTKPCSLSCV